MPRDSDHDKTTWQKFAMAHQDLIHAICQPGVSSLEQEATLEMAESMCERFLETLRDDFALHAGEKALLIIRTRKKEGLSVVHETALILGVIAKPALGSLVAQLPLCRYVTSREFSSADIESFEGPLVHTAIRQLIRRLWVPVEKARCSIELYIGDEGVDAWFAAQAGTRPFLKKELIAQLSIIYKNQLSLSFPLGLVH